MKKGRNFMNNPTKNPAAKKTIGFCKHKRFLFMKNAPFLVVLYDILCKNRVFGYREHFFFFTGIGFKNE